MNIKILKIELVIQLIVAAICLVYVIFELFANNSTTIYFLGLLIIGAFNLMGFLVRICVTKSEVNKTYFFAVILFFVVLFICGVIKPSLLMYQIGIFGPIYFFYYIFSGFSLIKDLK